MIYLVQTIISTDRKREVNHTQRKRVGNTVAGNMVGELGFAGGKNERTMELVSATSKTRRITSLFDTKKYLVFSLVF